MTAPEVVLDTNVLVSTLRSQRGASFRLLQLVDSGKFFVNLSVPLVLEYEEVCKRLIGIVPLSETDIDAVVNYLCRVGRHQPVHFLWRPFLPDPEDDMLLELAVAANHAAIVTFNRADFRGADQFGIEITTPRDLLRQIGEIP
jgi:putative PIN family toxin of toxin-antitoxin system